MALPLRVFVVIFLFLFSDHMLPLSSASSEECPYSFDCGNLGKLTFPYTTPKHSNCGILAIHDCENPNPNSIKTVQFSGKKFQVKSLDPFDNKTVILRDTALQNSLEKYDCDAFSSNNITLPPTSPLGYFYTDTLMTFYRCNISLKVSPPKQFLKYGGCGKSNNETIFFGTQDEDDHQASLEPCPRVQLPVNHKLALSDDPFKFIVSEFSLGIWLSDDCYRCSDDNKGICLLDGKGAFRCSKSKDHGKRLAMVLGLIISVFGILVLASVLMFRHYKQKQEHIRLGSTNHNPNKEPDLDSGRLFFGVPIFSYKELQEATSNFNPSNQLGEGGFGSVYHGKLQDGREVAVKHLFNYNYKRVEQFITEVEILTRLRHTNLVSLYGCTSWQSRELLLVYEYIPNGTLASHLHGGSTIPSLLTWPIRMKIAIETASALAYLHASGIIHRDVKTNNILLDNNFCVKVADFGLSRSFPDNVSHVSTGPQGTPGYLDPEYYFCYRLTNKSDVYSFGVVLMELISSMPAVDIRRNKDEMSLGGLAIRKIQRNEFEELVDPCLGIEKDNEMKKKVLALGALAFQCLQVDKEMRPSMDEVLEVLREIESGKEEEEEEGVDIEEDKATVRSRVMYDKAKLFKSSSSPNSDSTTSCRV